METVIMTTRGIPPVSDYAHWNEDAELMWYEENKYDMANEPWHEDDYLDAEWFDIEDED
jgi:hypothetical protein